MTRPPSGPPAGWYPDPFGQHPLRYHDGRGWTAHGHPLAPAGPDRPVLDVGAAVGAAVVLVVSLILSRIVLEHLLSFGWPVAVYSFISALIGYGPSIAWCVVAARRWGSGDLRRDVGFRFALSDLGWGPLAWVSCVVAQIAVASLILALDIPITSNTEGIRELDLDRTYVVSLLITAVVVAPFVEELVFRGVMLRGLRSRLNAAFAVAAQAVLFGLAHVDPARGTGNIGLALVLTAVGAVLGGYAHWHGRLGPTIVAHAILNGVVMAIVLTT